jgi:hypothetical protein
MSQTRKTRGIVNQEQLEKASELQMIATDVLGVSPGNQTGYRKAPTLDVGANQFIDPTKVVGEEGPLTQMTELIGATSTALGAFGQLRTQTYEFNKRLDQQNSETLQEQIDEYNDNLKLLRQTDFDNDVKNYTDLRELEVDEDGIPIWKSNLERVSWFWDLKPTDLERMTPERLQMLIETLPEHWDPQKQRDKILEMMSTFTAENPYLTKEGNKFHRKWTREIEATYTELTAETAQAQLMEFVKALEADPQIDQDEAKELLDWYLEITTELNPEAMTDAKIRSTMDRLATNALATIAQARTTETIQFYQTLQENNIINLVLERSFEAWRDNNFTPFGLATEEALEMGLSLDTLTTTQAVDLILPFIMNLREDDPVNMPDEFKKMYAKGLLGADFDIDTVMESLGKDGIQLPDEAVLETFLRKQLTPVISTRLDGIRNEVTAARNNTETNLTLDKLGDWRQDLLLPDGSSPVASSVGQRSREPNENYNTRLSKMSKGVMSGLTNRVTLYIEENFSDPINILTADKGLNKPGDILHEDTHDQLLRPLVEAQLRHTHELIEVTDPDTGKVTLETDPVWTAKVDEQLQALYMNTLDTTTQLLRTEYNNRVTGTISELTITGINKGMYTDEQAALSHSLQITDALMPLIELERAIHEYVPGTASPLAPHLNDYDLQIVNPHDITLDPDDPLYGETMLLQKTAMPTDPTQDPVVTYEKIVPGSELHTHLLNIYATVRETYAEAMDGPSAALTNAAQGNATPGNKKTLTTTISANNNEKAALEDIINNPNSTPDEIKAAMEEIVILEDKNTSTREVLAVNTALGNGVFSTDQITDITLALENRDPNIIWDQIGYLFEKNEHGSFIVPRNEYDKIVQDLNNRGHSQIAYYLEDLSDQVIFDPAYVAAQGINVEEQKDIHESWVEVHAHAYNRANQRKSVNMATTVAALETWRTEGEKPDSKMNEQFTISLAMALGNTDFGPFFSSDAPLVPGQTGASLGDNWAGFEDDAQTPEEIFPFFDASMQVFAEQVLTEVTSFIPMYGELSGWTSDQMDMAVQQSIKSLLTTGGWQIHRGDDIVRDDSYTASNPLSRKMIFRQTGGHIPQLDVAVTPTYFGEISTIDLVPIHNPKSSQVQIDSKEIVSLLSPPSPLAFNPESQETFLKNFYSLWVSEFEKNGIASIEVLTELDPNSMLGSQWYSQPPILELISQIEELPPEVSLSTIDLDPSLFDDIKVPGSVGVDGGWAIEPYEGIPHAHYDIDRNPNAARTSFVTRDAVELYTSITGELPDVDFYNLLDYDLSYTDIMMLAYNDAFGHRMPVQMRGGTTLTGNFKQGSGLHPDNIRFIVDPLGEYIPPPPGIDPSNPQSREYHMYQEGYSVVPQFIDSYGDPILGSDGLPLATEALYRTTLNGSYADGWTLDNSSQQPLHKMNKYRQFEHSGIKRSFRPSPESERYGRTKGNPIIGQQPFPTQGGPDSKEWFKNNAGNVIDFKVHDSHGTRKTLQIILPDIASQKSQGELVVAKGDGHNDRYVLYWDHGDTYWDPVKKQNIKGEPVLLLRSFSPIRSGSDWTIETNHLPTSWVQPRISKHVTPRGYEIPSEPIHKRDLDDLYIRGRNRRIYN